MSTLTPSSTTLPEPFETEFGFRARFLPSDDPNVLLAESWTRPGGGGGALHRHLHQTERFDVLDGAITVRVGRSSHVVGAGESFTVPAGAPHTFVNDTDREAHFRTTFSPRMRLDAFFTDLFATGRPGLRQAARLMRDYPDEFFYVAYVPVRAQRALGALVRATLGTR